MMLLVLFILSQNWTLYRVFSLFVIFSLHVLNVSLGHFRMICSVSVTLCKKKYAHCNAHNIRVVFPASSTVLNQRDKNLFFVKAFLSFSKKVEMQSL